MICPHLLHDVQPQGRHSHKAICIILCNISMNSSYKLQSWVQENNSPAYDCKHLFLGTQKPKTSSVLLLSSISHTSYNDICFHLHQKIFFACLSFLFMLLSRHTNIKQQTRFNQTNRRARVHAITYSSYCLNLSLIAGQQLVQEISHAETMKKLSTTASQC